MQRIIITEDDPMISEIYQKKFSDSGYEAVTANSGEKVLQLLKEGKFDAILLDLIMPKMDGFEVIKNIREVQNNQEVKIIVFSNLSQKEDRDKALNLGADGFIVKSDYAPSELIKEFARIVNTCNERKRNEMIRDRSNGIYEKNGKKRVLLIEDEDVFIEMFGTKLKQDGFTVESANNGAWGLKEALAKPFDIFIIDMVMPAMSGEEIIAKLKMEEKTKNIPIIVISASVENDVRKKVLEMGITEFFMKTQLIPSDLSKKVSEILEDKKEEEEKKEKEAEENKKDEESK